MRAKLTNLVFSAIAAALLLGQTSFAATDDPIGDERAAHVPEVRITAGAWLARLGGDVRLRNSPGHRLDVKDDLNLRDMEPTFKAELDLRKHDFYLLHLSGFSFSTDASGTFPREAIFGDVQFNPGDPYRASFDLTSVNGEVRFAVFRPFNNSEDAFNSDGRQRIRLCFGPLVGARYIDLDQTIEHVGVSRERTGGEWLAFHGGAHVELMFRPEGDFPWLDRLSVETAVSAGPMLGGDGGLVWQVQSTFRAYITENIAAHLGYRMVDMTAKRNGYELKGGLQGLFVGGTLSF